MLICFVAYNIIKRPRVVKEGKKPVFAGKISKKKSKGLFRKKAYKAPKAKEKVEGEKLWEQKKF